MGFLNKSKSSSSQSTQTLANENNNEGAAYNIGGNSGPVALTVTETDHGSVEAAFDFAGENSRSAADLARRAVDQSYDFAGTAALLGNEQATQAQDKALNFVTQNIKGDAEKTRETFNYLVYALLAAGVLVAYFIGGKK